MAWVCSEAEWYRLYFWVTESLSCNAVATLQYTGRSGYGMMGIDNYMSTRNHIIVNHCIPYWENAHLSLQGPSLRTKAGLPIFCEWLSNGDLLKRWTCDEVLTPGCQIPRWHTRRFVSTARPLKEMDKENLKNIGFQH